MFRKFALKQFALDYITPLGNFLRVANWIFPGFVSMGIFSIALPNNFLLAITMVYTLITVFFGFVYFRIFPIKESEYTLLSENQKFTYDNFYNKNPEVPKNLDPVWVALWNPAWVVLFVLLFYIYN